MKGKPHTGGPAFNPRITEAVEYYLRRYKPGGKRAPHYAMKDTAALFGITASSINSRITNMNRKRK